ncbi:hypothetical protein PQR71_39855 [Paraburkholderia fungorum]|uniref:hypothetical protein n=1 Tax=Paraburkholderia fungorum TaxID=134537 RepID=UPI0038B8141E
MSTNYSFTGAFNAATLGVPGAYINIQPPGQGIITPAQTGLMALAGVASFGPVNQATPTSANSLSLFGNPVLRNSDLVTHATIALQAQQAAGSGSLLLTRVTDGTDSAATSSVPVSATAATGYIAFSGQPSPSDTITLGGTAVTFVSALTTGNQILIGGTLAATLTNAVEFLSGSADTNLVKFTYSATATQLNLAAATTGTAGNSLTLAKTGTVETVSGATLSGGTAATVGMTLANKYTGSTGNGATWNITAGSSSTPSTPTWKLSLQVGGFPAEVYDNIGGTGAAFWTNAANAVNNGNSILRAASQFFVATVGSSTAAASVSNGTFSGGTDGATTITSAVLVGVDTPGARTGIYTWRNSGAAVGVVADLCDNTQEPTLIALGQSEGILIHGAGTPGETAAQGATNKQAVGTNNTWYRRWLGDWCYWNDNFNGQQRLVSPATFQAALQSTLQPQQSTLNKSAYGIVSTQRSRGGIPYASDELGILYSNSIDVIGTPCPGGPYFGSLIGRTSSSDATRNTDNWPVLTNFLARSVGGPNGVGTLIGEDITPEFFTDGYDMLLDWAENLADNNVIQAYQIIFGPANNPQTQTAVGEVVAQVNLQYFGIASVFLVNMQTGATVVVPPLTTAS